MLEIFDKAREYAIHTAGYHDFSVLDDEQYEMLGNEKGDYKSMGEWRLHKQAIKVLRMAIEKCQGNNGCHAPDERPPIRMRELLEAIDVMEARYGVGWSHEGDWHIKDYTSSDDLIDTLGFFRRMGVAYTRQDRNPLSEAIHLRVSNEDFDLIFNPIEDVNRSQGWGRG